MKLVELARTVRSKNAGPLKLTLDLLFDDEAAYRRALQSPVFPKRQSGIRVAGCRLCAFRITATGSRTGPWPRQTVGLTGVSRLMRKIESIAVV